MTKKLKTKKAEEPAPILDAADKVEELIADGLNIEETCYAIDLEVNWFSGSAAAKGAVADEMMKVAKAEKDAASISTNLFSSKHPLVAACEAAKRALYTFRDMKTFPLAKIGALLSTDSSLTLIESKPGGAGAGRRIVAKDSGIRVIGREKLDGFIQQIQEIYGPAVVSAVQKLNAALPQVLEFEKNRQGKLFRAENYPQEVHCSIRIQPRRIGLGIDFEKHCPNAAASLKAHAQKQLTDTVELAVADFVDSFLGCVKTVANQLGYRMRVRPDKKDPVYGYLHDAEVVAVVKPEDDPSIPAGQLAVEFRYLPAGEKRSKPEHLMLSEEQFQALRPYHTEERKKVVETSLEGFLWQLDRYREIADRSGAPGKQLGEIVAKARDVFHSAGDNTSQMLKEMRDSSFFRNSACKELAHVKDALQDLLVTLPAFKAKRRAVQKAKDAED